MPDTEVFRKNSVKMNLSSLAFRNYSFTYERTLARKITFVAGYSFMPSSQISSLPIVDKAIEIADISSDEETDSFEEDLKKGNVGTSAITGELRFYSGKKAGARGLYVSLYGRYTTVDLSYLDTYVGDFDIEHDLPYNAELKGFGGGIMFGAQWLIAKRVTLDWYIVGAHYGKLSGNLSALTDLSMLTEQERADLKTEVEDLFTIGDKKYVDATIKDNGMFGKLNGPFGGVRAFGFNLGIAF
ncbi:DUF3575 domain-containing protein [Pontibacter sp. BT327]|uniref:DUF3575 domain-containing protein n=1 Tax=Pontibacter burrus TaxID=2704466 RepID=A0A6B3LLI0_9BACT|nr:DUF3575 domain-containing protein [Pontibacter burrus]